MYPKGYVTDVDAIARFNSRWRVDGSGCHIWTGTLGSDGYGKISLRGRTMNAHRFSYQLSNGPIPVEPKLPVDHLCRVRICVNPEHLELVTYSENNRRAYWV